MKTMAAIALIGLLAGCANDADVASHNISREADQFRVLRRIVFYNGITGDYMLSIEGLCSLGNADRKTEISVTCKAGEGNFKKHYLGLSDNVTFFAEQLEPRNVSTSQYRVIFKPSAIIPDIEVR